MKKNEKREELQSRREFFKKAAKGALPILGAIFLASNPVITSAAEKTPMGCYYGCSSSCYGSCSGSCDYGCRDVCTSCQGGCKGSCQGSCVGNCTGSCHYSCVNISY